LSCKSFHDNEVAYNCPRPTKFSSDVPDPSSMILVPYEIFVKFEFSVFVLSHATSILWGFDGE